MMNETPHDPHIIIDSHEDIALNVTTYGRDFTRAAHATRQLERSDIPKKYGQATLGLPDALLGRVGLVFGTLFVAPVGAADGFYVGYETPAQAYQQAIDQIDVYYRLADNNERAQLVRTQGELAKVLATWADGTEFEQHKLGIVIAMENADSIKEPRQFEEWYERGVRSVGLAWVESRYSAGTDHPGKLTSLGRELLEVMESFNTILDLSHMADDAALEAIERYGGPIIASHSNPRRFCDTDRHLPDNTIRRLAERDGVMGTVLYNKFLQNGWVRGDRKERVTLANVIASIDHVCQLTGSARHVGIGSDFDGGFGAESIPQEFDTVRDLMLIGPALATRGYSQDDIHAILSGNFLRILRASLPK
jgi:membrane dipeptidase